MENLFEEISLKKGGSIEVGIQFKGYRGNRVQGMG